MRPINRFTIATLLVMLGAAPSVSSAAFAYTRVADQTTITPGTGLPFTAFTVGLSDPTGAPPGDRRR